MHKIYLNVTRLSGFVKPRLYFYGFLKITNEWIAGDLPKNCVKMVMVKFKKLKKKHGKKRKTCLVNRYSKARIPYLCKSLGILHLEDALQILEEYIEEKLDYLKNRALP